jgi:hypothetical protein
MTEQELFIDDRLGTVTRIITVDAPSRNGLTVTVGRLDQGHIDTGCGADCTGRVCGVYAKLLRAYQISGGSWRGVVEVTTSYDV